VFLEVYCEIRPLALNQYNIKKAWKKSGLLPFDPDIVLSQPKRPKPQAESQELSVEDQIDPQINAQIKAGTEHALTLNPTNSRPSTAQGAPPSLDLKTPDI
jgi:hypothetical protein